MLTKRDTENGRRESPPPVGIAHTASPLLHLSLFGDSVHAHISAWQVSQAACPGFKPLNWPSALAIRPQPALFGVTFN